MNQVEVERKHCTLNEQDNAGDYLQATLTAYHNKVTIHRSRSVIVGISSGLSCRLLLFRRLS